MLRLFDKIVALAGIFMMAGLLGAYMSSYVDPNTFVLPSLLGLAYPYLLLANVLLLFYWTLRWKKTACLELVVILLGIPAFMTYYGTAKVQDGEPKTDLALLSYNVRYFDFYNWSQDKNTKEKLFDYLNTYKGDVVCLQEFSMKSGSAEEKTLTKRLKTYPFHYIHDNTAIFSRLPVVGKGHLPFPEAYSGACLYCDVKAGNDTVRVYCVHLESYRLGKKERAFMKEISRNMTGSDLSDGARNLALRLTTANKNRAIQAEQIHRYVRRSPYPSVLCGDFNDTPLSYTYRKIKTGLEDAFIECGRGIGNTYIGEFPSFRIDYILHSPSLRAVSYFRDTVTLSDHYPIRGRLCLE